MKDMLEQFKSKNPQEMSYYETVRTFFKNPQLKVIDGLHRNFIYEIARHPSFVSAQEKINSAEDQITKYNNVSLDLLQLERVLLQKQSETETKISAQQKLGEKGSHSDLERLKNNLQNYKTQYQIAKRARNSIKQVRSAGIDRLEKDKVAYKANAAHALKTQFDEMLATLTKTLDQAEVLQYELYSGAGEHLRAQLAGAQMDDKDREALKVQDHKALKWDFKGEVWEDELGHYRSSLKNVCTKEDKVSKN
jgi:hypothetical protein